MMFTWQQIIVVVALMFVSNFLGYRRGKKIQERMTNVYRDMWVNHVLPDAKDLDYFR